MRKNRLMAIIAVVAAVLMSTSAAHAQSWSQNTACPGWNNPANFTAGMTANFYWSGQNGTKPNSQPNVMQGITGMTFSGSVLSASQLASATSGTTYCDNTSIPNHDKQFAIMSNLSGHDPNTGNQLPYIPWQQYNTNDTTGAIINTNLTKSIRIGDDCMDAKAAALYYNMKVTPDNAMFYIYYAIVVQAPGHGTSSDPTFVIRVMKKNSANQWVQISDTLAYYVTSTPASDGGSVVIGQNGWHAQGSGYSEVDWKEWAKVAVNLSNHMYENLRIEVLMGDCSASGHWGYAYICGECRQMKITSSGCPKGLSTDVTTLMAPRNMLNYVWYACDYGMLESSVLEDPSYSWHQLTEDVSANNFNYDVQAEDFRVTRALNEAGVPIIVDDTSNWQSFRCKMTSALDPAKPFDSYLYANVQNTKPTMKVDSLLDCRGGITLWNKSFVPGAPQLVLPDSTVWSFYNNAACGGDPVAVFRGDSVYMNFDTNGIQGLLVRTNTQQTGDEECYSEAKYQIQPRFRPKAAMTADPKVLCDADETTMVDITPGEVRRRVWRFRAANADPDDMTLSDSVVGYGDVNRSYSRSFSHAVEPIELLVNDGTFFLDFFNANDTVWCDTVVHDTVSVFLHPELEVTGDTMVCEGSTTDATVRALGVEGCTYEWSLTLGTVTGGLPSGPRLQVVPYADKATYYVKVTSPQGCVAWDSIHAYMVKPRLSMMPDDGRICPGGTATLTGSDAHHYTWTASPADASLAGQDSNDIIRVSPKVTTTYTMVGHGANNCDATPLKKTVKIVPLPVPTVKLTPGFIDTDNPQLVLRDVSPYSVATSWLFNDGSTAEGKEVSHTFDNCIGYDSVSVTMTSYNELSCPIDHPFAIPVKVFNAWFPNAFTPGSNDANDHFSLFTLNAYEYFHIYIYNRRGELVFESDDPNFSWDGTHDGEPLPQGAYVYTCRYRKPGTTTLGSLQGTVSLIR